MLKKTRLAQVRILFLEILSPKCLNFYSFTIILKVVGNTTRLMNPTSGGRSSESEVLATYLGMLDCDTVKRLFERWTWLSFTVSK